MRFVNITVTSQPWQDAIKSLLLQKPLASGQRSLADLLAAFKSNAFISLEVGTTLVVPAPGAVPHLLFEVARCIIVTTGKLLAQDECEPRIVNRAYTIIEDLLLADASIAQITDDRDISLLMIATNHQLDCIVELLIRYGADVSQRASRNADMVIMTWRSVINTIVRHSDVAQIPEADMLHPEADYKTQECAAMLALRKGYCANLIAKLLTPQLEAEIKSLLKLTLRNGNGSSNFIVDKLYHQQGIKSRTIEPQNGSAEWYIQRRTVAEANQIMLQNFAMAKAWRKYYEDLRSYYKNRALLMIITNSTVQNIASRPAAAALKPVESVVITYLFPKPNRRQYARMQVPPENLNDHLINLGPGNEIIFAGNLTLNGAFTIRSSGNLCAHSFTISNGFYTDSETEARQRLEAQDRTVQAAAVTRLRRLA